MKLIRFGDSDHEKPGYLDDSQNRRDLTAFGEDFGRAFFESDGLSRLGEWLSDNNEPLPLVDPHVRWAPPIADPGKIVCVGLNYSDHAKESGMEIPQEPVLFFKSTTAICGPYDPILLPPESKKTDWEVELAVIIGKRASYLEESQAWESVAGYCILNDVSERAMQLEGTGQWVKGKSCDSFAPLGPMLVTPDELADPHNLDLELKVNDEIMQQSNTSNLIFKIPFLISYISRHMSLQPGDIISTGTPPGVGLGMDPPRYLKVSDTVELTITGLGSSKQSVQET